MSVCPFCKAQVSSSHGPCPRCGKVASDHPSIAATGGRNLSTDFDDDLGGGGIELEKGSGVGGGHGISTYGSEDGLSFDDDLDDGGHSGPLELDMPAPTPRSSGAHVVSAGPPSSNPAPLSAPHAPHTPRISGSHPAASISGTQPAAAPISEPRPSGVPGSNPQPLAPPPPPAKPLPPTPAQVIAKYPPAPRGIHLAPVYFFKVFYRQLEIRQDLESLRKRRSPDVPLYEAALQAHDKPAFTKGLAISAALFFVATLLFFTPVFLRFLRAP